MSKRVQIAALVVALFAVTACSEERFTEEAASLPTPVVSTVPEPTVVLGNEAKGAPDQRPASENAATIKVAEQLGAEESLSLAMGGAFNARFLALAYQSVGLSADEANCVASLVRDSTDGFETLAVSEVASVLGENPALTTICVEPDRLVELTNRGAQPDFASLPIESVRSLLGELLVAQFTRRGLNETEASCVALDVVATNSGNDPASLFTGITVDNSVVAASVEACVGDDRLSELSAEL